MAVSPICVKEPATIREGRPSPSLSQEMTERTAA
jgi:hypothetical protein